MHPVLGRPMTPEEYAENWTLTAGRLNSEGHYAWMVQQLGSASTILEVGCGSGVGTEALVRAGSRTVSIEVNEALAEMALSRLKAVGQNARMVSEGAPLEAAFSSECQATIVSASVFSQWLDDVIPPQSFDAIVCWLIGASPDVIGHTLEADPAQFTGGEMAAYREQVHQRCYELGRSVLRPGGVVHIVDRMHMSSWSDKGEFRHHIANSHSELAGPAFDVKAESCLMRKVQPRDFGTSQIQYIAEAPPGGVPRGIMVLGSSRATLRS